MREHELKRLEQLVKTLSVTTLSMGDNLEFIKKAFTQLLDEYKVLSQKDGNALISLVKAEVARALEREAKGTPSKPYSKKPTHSKPSVKKPSSNSTKGSESKKVPVVETKPAKKRLDHL